MIGSTHLPGTSDKEGCIYYDDDLATGSHKDNDVVICGNCGTSAVQLW